LRNVPNLRITSFDPQTINPWVNLTRASVICSAERGASSVCAVKAGVPEELDFLCGLQAAEFSALDSGSTLDRHAHSESHVLYALARLYLPSKCHSPMLWTKRKGSLAVNVRALKMLYSSDNTAQPAQDQTRAAALSVERYWRCQIGGHPGPTETRGIGLRRLCRGSPRSPDAVRVAL
jgi:hypothetical protein